MTRIIAFNFIILLSWQLIFLTCTTAQDEILHGMIKDGENEIHLTWKKTRQLLANENLPIWIANNQNPYLNAFNSRAQHELKHNFIRENFGGLVFYHDEEKLSAVVYFEKTKTIHGIIDTRYIISKLPIDECNLGHQVGGDYIIRLDQNMNIHADLKPPVVSTSHDKKNKFFTCDHPNKRQKIDENLDGEQVTTFYPEILLFVPYDVVMNGKNNFPNNYLSIIVKHYIIFFNAIDMFFAKLSKLSKNIKIYINLAGIVIENEKGVFTFMTPVTGPTPNPQMQYLDVEDALISISQYITTNKDTFPEDSFDFFFISTKNILWSTSKNSKVLGLSGKPNIYAGRKSQKPDRKLLGAAVHRDTPCEVGTATHEIAHLMYIEHESLEKGYRNHLTQCYAIMTTDGIFCRDCLKWTDQNLEDLKKYARTHPNRCFLLNTPRSLHPYGNIKRTLSPSQQCRCYGFESRLQTNLAGNLDEVPQTDCNRNLICHHNSNQVNTILPFDGTPCAADKVCWDMVCRDVSTASVLALFQRTGNNK